MGFKLGSAVDQAGSKTADQYTGGDDHDPAIQGIALPSCHVDQVRNLVDMAGSDQILNKGRVSGSIRLKLPGHFR